jgi:hypothetical protein
VKRGHKERVNRLRIAVESRNIPARDDDAGYDQEKTFSSIHTFARCLSAFIAPNDYVAPRRHRDNRKRCAVPGVGTNNLSCLIVSALELSVSDPR